jgi:hypothetical protein
MVGGGWWLGSRPRVNARRMSCKLRSDPPPPAFGSAGGDLFSARRLVSCVLQNAERSVAFNRMPGTLNPKP